MQICIAKNKFATGCRPTKRRFGAGRVDVDCVCGPGDDTALKGPVHQMVVATVEYGDMGLPRVPRIVAARFEIVAECPPEVGVATEQPGCRAGIEGGVRRHLT